ncbi:MAG: methylenetetrahydrofolate reductase [Planctomycetota bacterium]
MIDYVAEKRYHIEILPPKQNSEKLDEDLERFADKWQKVMDAGHIACVTDNAMGHLAFQATELIEELELPVQPDQVHVHLNTFHTKEDLDAILGKCREYGIRDLLLVTGDGSERLPKLTPTDLGVESAGSVTSVDLLTYIQREHPDAFDLGVAFNPYEPEEHEFEKMRRKVDAGARFVITQPILEKNALVDRMRAEFGLPTVVEAWMSKKLHLLSECVGYEIPEDTEYDPIATLKQIHAWYPDCGVYLAILGFKTQYPILDQTW